MKLEIEFTEEDSLESVLAACRSQYEAFFTRYAQSKERYIQITQRLSRAVGSERDQLHEMADCIEEDWVRWGVVF